jgi:adenylate kinase
MILTLLGAPGSGKGTQGRRLAERLGLAYLSSGDLLRSAIARGTEPGRRARPYLEKGDLVPDAILVPLICGELQALCAGAGDADDAPDTEKVNGVVLDGFPRTREQAIELDTMSGGECAVDAALYLRVPDEVVISRLASRLSCEACGASFSDVTKLPRHEGVCDSCGGALSRRGDDSAHMVRQRLAVYANAAAPLIAYYRDRDSLIEIEGNAPEPEVATALLKATRTLSSTYAAA